MKKGPGRAGLIHEAFLSRDIYSCWWSIFPNNSLENRVQFPAKRNAFVLDHQNCRRDVTCKAGPGCSKAGYRYPGGEGRGTHLSLSHTHTPTQIFFSNALCVARWHKQTCLQSSWWLACP